MRDGVCDRSQQHWQSELQTCGCVGAQLQAEMIVKESSK